MKRFQFIEHTADIGLIAYGRTLAEAFANAAYGMFSIITELKAVKEIESRQLEIGEDDLEALLFGWLNSLIYFFDVEMLLFKRFDISELGKKVLTQVLICDNIRQTCSPPVGYGFGCIPGRVFIKDARYHLFFDGQHLYRSAKDAWRPLPAIGHSRYSWPSYDVIELANKLASKDPKRTIKQIRFYTGVPDKNINPQWHTFWTNKLRYLKSQGVVVYKGRINRAGQEKGVDVRIAIDLIQLTYEQEYDVATIISQDWDFGSAVFLSKKIARGQGRHLIFESCFPVGQGTTSTRGIPGTNWIPIDKATCDACFDTRDYRGL